MRDCSVHYGHNHDLRDLPMSTYQGIGPLFDICANRHKGNEQSVSANKKVDKNKQRAVIMSQVRFYWKHGVTCDELECILNMPHQTCSARISELKRDGLIRKIGTRPTRSGCQAAVYQVNETSQ